MGKRKDLSGDSQEYGGVAVVFDEKQISFIEKSGRVKLTDPLKKELAQALTEYSCTKGFYNDAPRREDVYKELLECKKGVDSLFEFFGVNLRALQASRSEARRKIEEQAAPLADNLSGAFAGLHLLKEATDKAIEKFEKEGAGDAGGKAADDALNLLSVTVDKIYKKSPGVHGAAVDFLWAVIEALPASIRPPVPKNPESLRKRKDRAKKKASKSL